MFQANGCSNLLKYANYSLFHGQKLAIHYVICLYVYAFIIEALINHQLNQHKGYHELCFIVTMEIWISISMHSHICLVCVYIYIM